MKTIYRCLAFSVLFFATACTDLLDIQPDGQSTVDDAFNTELSTEQYFNSCYEAFPQYAVTWGWISNQPIAISDDCYETNTQFTNASAVLYGGIASTKEADNKFIKHTTLNDRNKMYSLLSSWDLYFQNIARCNLFMAKLPEAPISDESKRSRFMAEARVLRAYYYMELLMQFGEVPIFKDNTEVKPEDLKKNSIKEIVEFIVDECEDVIASCPDLAWRHQTTAESYRMSKAVASAIKSRVALFYASPLYTNGENNWAYAARVTRESLDELLANGFYLETTIPSAPYTSAYQKFNTSAYSITGGVPTDYETIYISKTTIGSQGSIGHSSADLGNVRAGLCPTQSLVDAYPMADGTYVLDLLNPYNYKADGAFVLEDPNYVAGSSYDPNRPYEGRDPRFYAAIHYNQSSGIHRNNGQEKRVNIYKGGASNIKYANIKFTSTGYYQRKFTDPTQGGPVPVVATAWRIFQLAEIYHNAAEAAFENGDATYAIDLINAVRERAAGLAKMTNPGNEEMLRAMLHNERRVEFAFCENRYYDLRRWGTAEEDMPEVRYPMAMWIELGTDGEVNDGTYSYYRVPVGVEYNSATKKLQGAQIEKRLYSAKHRLHPLALEEANRLREVTGVDWQNIGW